MTIIRYVDIYKTEITEEGPVDTLELKDATLPMCISPERVDSVQPFFNGRGKQFKNVSYLNYNGELIKIVGNYVKLDNYIKDYSKNSRIEVKGYYGR